MQEFGDLGSLWLRPSARLTLAVVPSTPSSLLLLRLAPSLSFSSLLANHLASPPPSVPRLPRMLPPRGPLPATLVFLLLSSLVPTSSAHAGTQPQRRALAFHERYAHKRAIADLIPGLNPGGSSSASVTTTDADTSTTSNTRAEVTTTTPVTTSSTSTPVSASSSCVSPPHLSLSVPSLV